jgi:hypothetical protein
MASSAVQELEPHVLSYGRPKAMVHGGQLLYQETVVLF